MRDPFHSGERAIQELTGERDTALINGQLVADRIPAAAKLFLTQQRYCGIGWSSTEGDVWAALIAGPPGFADTDKELRTLYLRLDDDADRLAQIPPFAQLREGDSLGTLFIELATRRRLRVNGRVTNIAKDGVTLTIDQANPLCPKYIQRRQIEAVACNPATTEIMRGKVLDEGLIRWITTADTFFVASAHPDRSADVSHRGGKPGFVQYQDGVLRIPDYHGNSMFNTLGNFALNPRAGLVFVDFESNRQLQMTGDVSLKLEDGIAGVVGSAASTDETGGTGRRWEFKPRQWVVSSINKLLAWKFLDPSPFNP